MKHPVKKFYSQFSFSHTDMEKQCQKIARDSVTYTKKHRYFIDIGCAEGGYVKAASKYYHYAIGVDFCFESLKKAAQSENCFYICADAEHLPLKNESADFVQCRGMLHHLDSEKNAVLEAVRILEKNSGYSISVYAHNGYYRFLYRIFHSFFPFIKKIPGGNLLLFLVFCVYFQAGCILAGRKTAPIFHLRNRYMDHFFAPVQLFFSEKKLLNLIRYSKLSLKLKKTENFGMMHTLVMSKNKFSD